MTKSRATVPSRVSGSTGDVFAVLLLSWLLCSTAAVAEPATPEETTPPEATELKIYKQRIKVTAEVRCRVYERRPINCIADVKNPISATLQPALILKYSGLKVGDKAFEAQTTPDHNISFRADEVNLSGQQPVDIDVIYVK
jgi:hypothetical protein